MSSGSHNFLDALRDGCRRCRLNRAAVLVAVSGGADSVALLNGLHLLRDEFGLTLRVAHLNHQLRGAESDADAAWVAELCRKLDVPCDVGREEVAAAPERARLGLEGTARLVRRRFLQRVARENRCDAIALAHTADDQSETILHQILRGTGLGGLRGMHFGRIGPSSDQFADSQDVPVIRPLMEVDRQLLITFLAEQGQDYRTDSSNADTGFTRNRIRHELLPLLARDFNPQIRQALLRLGQQAQEVYADEELLARKLLDEALLEVTADHCRLRLSFLRDQPRRRVRECFVVLWKRQAWPRREMGFADWERLARFIHTDQTAITLPGKILVRMRDDLLMLSRQQE